MESVAVVGLGYVGLPLALAFGAEFPTIGYDLSERKVESYRDFCDPSGEITESEMRSASRLEFTNDPALINRADFIVVAVPTPIDRAHQPDFAPLVSASETVGKHMKRGAVVIYESTVYPGATEEVCIPVLERHSRMTWKRDFSVGYSPERINPGDKEHTLRKIIKVVAGDTPETLGKVARLYESVVEAGVHRVSSIRVAESAKVIENTQRDLNIALMNELAIIFGKLGIDTLEVLKAAGTKWNFLPFRPGLVGGHCIGVDPYYLTHKADLIGYHPQVILAGRRINDDMAKYVAENTVKALIDKGSGVKGGKVNVLGLTFKENCRDLRNSKVADVVKELADYGLDVSVHDPVASPADALHEYGIHLRDWDSLPTADAVVLAVTHREYLDASPAKLLANLRPGGCVIDVKSALDALALRKAGYHVWRL